MAEAAVSEPLDEHDAYYDYAPTVALERPLALTGFMGAGIIEVASSLSTRTGLNLIEIPRWAEHTAGKSLSHVYLREGEGRLRALERGAVQRALRDRPFGILVLGDGTLLDDETRELLRKNTTLVYLRRNLSTLFQQVRTDLLQSPGCYPAWMMSPPADEDALAPLFERCRPGYESAHVTIDAGTRSSTTLAEELLLGLRSGTLRSTANA
jgi:shikimate kinase